MQKILIDVLILTLGLLLPLLLTISIEGALAYAFGWSRYEQRALLFCNLITNPCMNLIIYLAYWLSFYSFMLVVVLEIIVIIVEWKLLELQSGSRRRFFVWSLLFNASSYALGDVIIKLLQF